jgi:hypothetical protein
MQAQVATASAANRAESEDAGFFRTDFLGAGANCGLSSIIKGGSETCRIATVECLPDSPEIASQLEHEEAQVWTDVVSPENMSLTDKDRAWIREDTNPKGWRRASENIIAVCTPIAIIAVFLALIAITLGALYQSFGHLKEETEFRTNTNRTLAAIGVQMTDLRALTIAFRPEKKENQNAAKELLAEARSKAIPPIPPATVERAGASFIDASATQPTAWNVALDFVAYRTTLQENLLAATNAQRLATTPVDIHLSGHYEWNDVPGHGFPTITVGGDVPFYRAATAYLLSKSNLDAGQARGKEVILAIGGALSLDDMAMKHVVLRDVVVFYSGGPVDLKDVIFVNCTFVLANSDTARRFATAVLASTKTSFMSS